MEEFKILKFIPFKSISGWDIRILFNKAVQFKYETVLVKDIITPVKADISKKNVQEKGISIISKINFGGELFLREKDEVKTYKGNLFLISEGQFIFSKINARNGCIYFHDKPFEFAVSSEYPAFLFDKEKVNGYYLWLLLRSNYIKGVLKSKATGHSKARVTYDDFYDLEIPLPDIDEQVKLVQAYKQAIEDAKQAEIKAKNLETEIDSYLLNELGIEVKTKTIQKGLQFVRFKNVDKWGIDFICLVLK
jgi:type I restriction enzyme S subunit